MIVKVIILIKFLKTLLGLLQEEKYRQKLKMLKKKKESGYLNTTIF
jgi:hypothetical protein